MAQGAPSLDESHNLRNREGKRYRIIRDYIQRNDRKCILRSATPYNKTYLDLGNQLRLLVEEDKDLGIRPERLLKDIGETEFIRRHQCPVKTLAAFEKSDYADDWRELMRLYMVRRTRSFIEQELRPRGVKSRSGVTGEDEDPTSYAWRFSPESNRKRATIAQEDELRILVATHVLSEGQNLQDGFIIVNFDLPWAIIRLIQRAGRVDRIGQRSENILAYSFLPADGVERIIRLRSRVRQRLRENAEVVGTDESFFEDEKNDQIIHDLFTKKSGILDDPADNEVDLASLAYQIWKNAIDRDPALRKLIPEMPNLVYSMKSLSTLNEQLLTRKPGVLAYMRTAEDNDALAWLDTEGNTVTESQFEILKAAECSPDTPALARQENHHKPAVVERLKQFDFPALFTQGLGWDKHSAAFDVTFSGQNFVLSAIAEKRGMVVLHCPSLGVQRREMGNAPSKTRRRPVQVSRQQPYAQII